MRSQNVSACRPPGIVTPLAAHRSPRSPSVNGERRGKMQLGAIRYEVHHATEDLHHSLIEPHCSPMGSGRSRNSVHRDLFGRPATVPASAAVAVGSMSSDPLLGWRMTRID